MTLWPLTMPTVVIYLILVFLSAGQGCDSNLSAYYYFTSSSPWHCNGPSQCLQSWCTCMNASASLVDGSCDRAYNTTDLLRLEQCATARFNCMVGAAVSSFPGNNYNSSNACDQWSSWLVGDYAQHYYNSTNKSSSSLFKACSSAVCKFVYPIVNSTGNVSRMCDFSGVVMPPYNPMNQGGGPSPSDPHCNANFSMYFSNGVPWQCGGPSDCLQSWCGCINASWVNGNCGTEYNITDLSRFEQCGTAQFNCMVNAAVKSFPGSNNNQLNVCDQWSLWVVGDYAQHYYNSSNKTSSALYNACSSTACNFVYPILNTTGNASRMCAFSGVEVPPYNPNCNSNFSMYFSNSVPWQCSGPNQCLQSWCGCMNASWTNGMCDMVYKVSNPGIVEQCVTSLVNCMVNAAVSSFPGSHMNASNVCDQWSSWVVGDYAQHYYNRNKASSALYNACSSTACDFVYPILNTAGNASRMCGFSGVALPPYNPMNQSSNGTAITFFNQCGAQPQLYLVGDLAKACPNVRTNCDPGFCQCIGGMLVSGNCDVTVESLNVSTLERCGPGYFGCVVDAAISSVASPTSACQQWASTVVNDYAMYIFAPSNATKWNTSFYRECASSVCNVELSFYNKTGNYSDLCKDIRGSSPLPYNPYEGAGGNCDPNYRTYFTSSSPWHCNGPSQCLQSWCTCMNASASLVDGSCDRAYNTTDLLRLEQCATARFNCMVGAAVSSFPGNNYNSSNACDQWSSWLVGDYAQHYYNSTNKSSSSLFKACSSAVCKFVYPIVNSTGNVSRMCGFSGVVMPPYNPMNQSTSEGGGVSCVPSDAAYFESMPSDNCTLLSVCLSNFCGCGGGVVGAHGDCQFATLPTLPRGIACYSSGIRCIVESALTLYVPLADDRYSNVCVAWSVGLARDYADWFVATDKRQTRLFGACNFTGCSQIVGMLGGVAGDVVTACSFNGLESIPRYVASNPCPLVCPDKTCAKSLSQCLCAANATLSNIDVVFDRPIVNTILVTNTLSGLAYGCYGISTVGANCSNFSFTPFMRYRWELRNSTGVVVFSVNSSSLRMAENSLQVGQAYRLTLVVLGLVETVRETRMWNFTVVAPDPVVSITRRGSVLRITNARAYAVLTFIQDFVPGLTPAFNWSCAVVNRSTACETLSNTSMQQLWIPQGYPIGTYNIRFSYKSGAANSTVQVTVVPEEIPVVRILMTSVPLVATPVVYLPSQMILFAAAVAFNGTYTVTWRVNGAVAASMNRSLAVMASTLISDSENSVYVKVTSSSDANVYGEATFLVGVAPRYTLLMSVNKSGDISATFATAISDRLLLAPTSSITLNGAPYGASYQFSFGYFTANNSRFAPLRVVPSGSDFLVDAPYPSGGSGSVVPVVFAVVLSINGIDVLTFNQTFNVAKPNAAAAAAQVTQALSVTDPSVALDVANNLVALMNENASMAGAAAIAMVEMLANSVTDTSSLSGS